MQTSASSLVANPNLGLHTMANNRSLVSTDTGPAQRDQVAGPLTSALEGLSVQQLLDMDVENMAVTIDHATQTAKKYILDHFMEVKTKMLAARNVAMEEGAKAAGLKLAAKQAEVDLLQFELHQANSRANCLSDIMHNLAVAFDRNKHKQRCWSLMVQAFYAWRQRSIHHRQRALRLQRGLHWYHVEHLQRHVLRGWYTEAMRLRKVSVQEDTRQHAQMEQEQLLQQWNAQMDGLRQQLTDAHTALQQEREQREKLEDSMKQAFMRGVCALNIEAMSIMKRGAAPAGVNPFPTRLAPAGSPAGGTLNESVPPAMSKLQPSMASTFSSAGSLQAPQAHVVSTGMYPVKDAGSPATMPSMHTSIAAGGAAAAGSSSSSSTNAARARVVVERGPGVSAASPQALAAVAAVTAAAVPSSMDAAPQPRAGALPPGPTARERERAHPLSRLP